MDTEVATTIAGSVFGSQVLTTFFQHFFQKKKTDADAAATLVQSVLQWQQTLTERIAALEGIVKAKDQVIEELRQRIFKLENSKECLPSY